MQDWKTFITSIPIRYSSTMWDSADCVTILSQILWENSKSRVCTIARRFINRNISPSLTASDMRAYRHAHYTLLKALYTRHKVNMLLAGFGADTSLARRLGKSKERNRKDERE